MKRLNQFLSKMEKALFFLLLVLGVLFVTEAPSYAAWSLETADSKIRQAVGIILFLLTVFLAIRAYARGRKGMAVMEILVGAFIWIFVTSKDPMQNLGEFFKSLFGF